MFSLGPIIYKVNHEKYIIKFWCFHSNLRLFDPIWSSSLAQSKEGPSISHSPPRLASLLRE